MPLSLNTGSHLAEFTSEIEIVCKGEEVCWWRRGRFLLLKGNFSQTIGVIVEAFLAISAISFPVLNLCMFHAVRPIQEF